MNQYILKGKKQLLSALSPNYIPFYTEMKFTHVLFYHSVHSTATTKVVLTVWTQASSTNESEVKKDIAEGLRSGASSKSTL